jgi:hypothetical protein
MSSFRHRTRAFQKGLIWVVMVVLVTSSTINAIAISHAAMNRDAFHAVSGVSEAKRSGCADTAKLLSGLAKLAHEIAHAWHHCGVVMAVLDMPMAKLMSLPPARPPSVEKRPAASPVLLGLFRPPIR